MRKALIIVISPVLLLTGCSSGMSLEEAVKLAEYENCLNVRGNSYQVNSLNQGYGVDYDKDGEYDSAPDHAQRVCAPYLP